MSFERRFELPTFEDDISEECETCPGKRVCHTLSFCIQEDPYMKPVRLPIINVDRRNNTVMVESKTKKFPVKPTCNIEDVRRGDDAIVVKSPVNGEWLMIDYRVDTAFNYAIHNSLQTSKDELICNDEGVPYDF